MQPEHAPIAQPVAADRRCPRASDRALAQQRARLAQHRTPRRPGQPPRGRAGSRVSISRIAIAGLATAGLLLTGLGGAVPLAAAEGQRSEQRDDHIVVAETDLVPAATPKRTPWPTPPGVKGLDVSHWNGFPDFGKLRAKGMRFVFSKASQGTSFVDDTYQRHTREARDAGLLPGAYHFFDYRKGGIAQARHFLDTLRATSGLGALLPLVVDVETLSTLGQPNRSLAKRRLHALMDELYRQTGRYPMIYTSRHMWSRVVGAPTSFGKYPLWVACWKCDTVYLPAGWSDWDFWQVGQFKFGGGVKLDGNAYRRSMPRLRLERQRGMRIDGGKVWTTSRTVRADLQGYDGTHVRAAFDDGTYGPWRPFQPRMDIKLPARQGRRDVRLQLRSFRGVRSKALRDDIKLDSKPPDVDGPSLGFQRGGRVQRSGVRVPTIARMSATDKTSGLKSSSLKATCDGVQRAAAFSGAGTADLPVKLDRRGCAVRARARDHVGLVATRRVEPSVALIDIRKGGGDVSFRGRWESFQNADALGKTLTRASAKGAQARVVVDGAQVAIVARRGPAGGRFKVILDGKHVDTIDLYAKDGDARRIVWVRAVPKGRHVLKLKATGSSMAKSNGSIVWLDAVLVLDRRT